MFPILPTILLAQEPQAFILQDRQQIIQSQPVRPLPGKLDQIPVFNSNSPEVVQSDGILLSTFPGQDKNFPGAHLNQTLNGRFDFFSHHIARPVGEKRTLYQGVIVYNPTNKPITLKVLQGLSYVNSTDAPFRDLPPLVEDPDGRFFSGPGSRLAGDWIRGVSNFSIPKEIFIFPRQYKLLFSLPIPPSNSRSTLVNLESDGKLYIANLAMYGIKESIEIATKTDTPLPPSTFRQPGLNEWISLLDGGNLAFPRDLAPATLPKHIYGRVAGISLGSQWTATITDIPNSSTLSIPTKGKGFSYPLSTTDTGTHGTQQIQSAPIVARYSDTAERSHGNYGVHYNFKLPLSNSSNTRKTVAISIQTPLKQNEYSDRLFFVNPPESQIFFRGTVRVSYQDDFHRPQTRYFHLIQRRGEQSSPLITLSLLSGEVREVVVDFLYPPDATPPQVLTIQTIE